MEQFMEASTVKEQRAIDEQNAFLIGVYMWMAGGLALTALIAHAVMVNQGLAQMVGGFYFILVIAELAAVFWLSFRIWKMEHKTATILFAVYAALNGLTIGFVINFLPGALIGQAFAITAGTFAGAAMIGKTTKTDLTAMGGVLRMAVWGLILASVVNFFWDNSGFTSIINYGAVIIFVGLTAYESQALKNSYWEARRNGTLNKLSVIGALSLYINFIVIFMHIISILSRRND